MVLIYNCFFQFTTSQGGRPDDPTKLGILDVLSIHDLTRRSTVSPANAAFRSFVFQFTTSQGGRHSAGHLSHIQLIFQFTTSQGGRRNPGLTPCRLCSFNSRPHKEVDAHNQSLLCRDVSFNSRPHKEVDRRMYPTRWHCNPFNSRPHKEVDAHNQSLLCRDVSFNSRPHKEVDDYVKDGGGDDESFNSRPHKEVDIFYSPSRSTASSFNSRPHKEVDLPASIPCRLYPHFQFTTSQGGRLTALSSTTSV